MKALLFCFGLAVAVPLRAQFRQEGGTNSGAHWQFQNRAITPRVFQRTVPAPSTNSIPPVTGNTFSRPSSTFSRPTQTFESLQPIVPHPPVATNSFNGDERFRRRGFPILSGTYFGVSPSEFETAASEVPPQSAVASPQNPLVTNVVNPAPIVSIDLPPGTTVRPSSSPPPFTPPIYAPPPANVPAPAPPQPVVSIDLPPGSRVIR
jgi:hypothetical protein